MKQKDVNANKAADPSSALSLSSTLVRDISFFDLKHKEAKFHAGRIWKLFVERCAVETFGEQAVITEGKKQVNFLGSVESYRLIYDEVVATYFSVENTNAQIAWDMQVRHSIRVVNTEHTS
jgi:hypothetical protein